MQYRIKRLKRTNIINLARYSEDALEKVIREGVKQYIILRVEILLHFDDQVRMGTSSKLHFIPVDFKKDSQAAALNRSPSFDSRTESFFSRLFVTMYLTLDELFATLHH